MDDLVSKRFLREPSGSVDKFEFRMKALRDGGMEGPQPGVTPVTKGKDRPVASCLSFHSSSKIPGPDTRNFHGSEH